MFMSFLEVSMICNQKNLKYMQNRSMFISFFPHPNLQQPVKLQQPERYEGVHNWGENQNQLHHSNCGRSHPIKNS